MDNLGFPVEILLVFSTTILFSIYIDLWAHRNHQEISLKDASFWSLFWIGLALSFYFYLWFRYDKSWAELYLTGYVLEKTLSIDNLMVFVAIFAHFNITGSLQHRILYWGILGALLFRAIFVLIGTSLFTISHWIGFIFSAFVIWSGYKMLTSNDDKNEVEDYSNHFSIKLLGKLIPVYPKLFFKRFLIKNTELNAEQLNKVTRKGAIYATPALLCLIAIETSDIAFSFDSVPAVISVTQQPLLIYSAMIFAILGLRSLYFLLTSLTKYLIHLEKSVIILLFFIGIKIGIQSWNHAVSDTGIHISSDLSLYIVLGILGFGVIASLIFPEKQR